jgi:hypothetical protein
VGHLLTESLSAVLPGAPYPDGFSIAELTFSKQRAGD